MPNNVVNRRLFDLISAKNEKLFKIHTNCAYILKINFTKKICI